MILNDTNKDEIIDEKNKKINNLEEEIEILKAIIESNQNKINEKDNKIASLENQNNSYNKSQSKKISELNEKKKELLINSNLTISNIFIIYSKNNLFAQKIKI